MFTKFKEDIEKIVFTRSIRNKNFYNNILLSKKYRISLERIKSDFSTVNRNNFIIGDAGTGKTRNFVIPNLLQLNTSYIVTHDGTKLYKDYNTFFSNNNYDVIHINFCANTFSIHSTNLQAGYLNFELENEHTKEQIEAITKLPDTKRFNDLENLPLTDIFDTETYKGYLNYDYSSLGFQKTIVFISMNGCVYDNTHIIIEKMLNDLINISFKDGFIAPVITHLILDDFQLLQKIDRFEVIINITAKRNIYLSLLVNDIQNMVKNYNDLKYLLIINNFNYWIFMGGFIHEKSILNCFGYNSAELEQLPKYKCILRIRGQGNNSSKIIEDNKYQPENHPNYTAKEI